jgi:phage terminase large subunit-like protein
METAEDISPAELRVLVSKTLERREYRTKYNKLGFYEPYPRQREFHDLGLTRRERLLMAGNQQGKTYCGGNEDAYHLTGLYPADWKGFRFKKPIKAWVCGVSGQKVRDVLQSLLLGPAGRPLELGTGAVPLECIKETVRMHGGLQGAFDYAVIEHRTNGKIDGESFVWFKSYEQGRAKFQSDQIDLIHLDEEPEDSDIYSECLARLTATGGIIYMTYTALLGPTPLTNRFMDEPSNDRAYVVMTIRDAKHIDPADYEKIEMSYPAHERDCRIRGIPMRGEGAIFPIPLETLIHDIPMHKFEEWTQWGWGIDFGIGHAFGAVLGCFNPYNNTLYLLQEYKQRDKLPMHHCAIMRDLARGDGIPVFWPHDGERRDPGTRIALKGLYGKDGARMHAQHSTLKEGGYGLEGGLALIHSMMDRGQFKVARHMANGEWGKEYRAYHRKDNQVVKINDDLMSATRMLAIMLRHTKPLYLCAPGAPDRQWDGTVRHRDASAVRIADGVDFDPFHRSMTMADETKPDPAIEKHVEKDCPRPQDAPIENKRRRRELARARNGGRAEGWNFDPHNPENK